jgi:hypothetical protein
LNLEKNLAGVVTMNEPNKPKALQAGGGMLAECVENRRVLYVEV